MKLPHIFGEISNDTDRVLSSMPSKSGRGLFGRKVAAAEVRQLANALAEQEGLPPQING